MSSLLTLRQAKRPYWTDIKLSHRKYKEWETLLQRKRNRMILGKLVVRKVVKKRGKANRLGRKLYWNVWVRSSTVTNQDGQNVYSFTATKTMMWDLSSILTLSRAVSSKIQYLSNISKNIWNSFLINRINFSQSSWASIVLSTFECISKNQIKFYCSPKIQKSACHSSGEKLLTWRHWLRPWTHSWKRSMIWR